MFEPYIEDPLVCQSTLKSCRSVRSVMNILWRLTHSIMYSNVNNLKPLRVVILPKSDINYYNYYQKVKILTPPKKKSIASGGLHSKTPCLSKIPTQAMTMKVLSNLTTLN